MGKFEHKPKDKSSIDRIVGGDEKKQEAIGAVLRRRFNDQNRFGKDKIFEREKTAFEIRAIRIANEATNALREKYGLGAYELPEENFHVLRDTKEVRDRSPHPDAHGEFFLRDQAAVLLEPQTPMTMLSAVFHEMTHFKSFASVQPEEDTGYEARRVGFYTRTREGKSVFNPLNEAVTEELTKRFMGQQEQNPELEKETADLREARAHLPPEKMEDVFSIKVIERSSDGRVKFTRTSFGYKEERKALQTLIDKLQERNPQVFRDKEEWFDMFASAMFNGHLLELARNIEKTFGQGKFRELGEQKTGEEFLKFVESL